VPAFDTFMVFDHTLIFSILIVFISMLGLSWFAGSDAPYVPTEMKRIREVLKRAGAREGIAFYELGSGDGRVVIAAAELGADSHGIEQSWIRVWYSRFIASKLKLKNCHFYHGDIFHRHYYPADIVYAYLLQPAIDKLEIKLLKELKKGSTIITQKYHFKNTKPKAKIGNYRIYTI
jgi:hypothetical protein